MSGSNLRKDDPFEPPRSSHMEDSPPLNVSDPTFNPSNTGGSLPTMNEAGDDTRSSELGGALHYRGRSPLPSRSRGGDGILVGEGKVKKQHTRSASHVGILRKSSEVLPHKEQGIFSNFGTSHGSISTYNKGHQRAFSHGQMNEGKGHKREGSRTDFILPEGHEQRERERESRPTKSSFKRTSLQRKGHSREASRTESVYTIRDQKKTFLQKVRFWKKNDMESCTRLVVPNHVVPADVRSSAHPNRGYPGNKICTTKYTLLTFLPKNLFEQFHRFANLYFLFIVLLNFAPSVNAFAKELAVLPLGFVLGVTAVKDAFEDMRRRKSDRRVNRRTCRVFSSLLSRYVKTTWEDLRVGDVVHLSCDETIPADMVLLNSSDDQGVCYIESSDLDGETNLKQRQSVRGIGMDDGFEVTKFDNVMEVGPPTTKIYHFVGSIPLNSRDSIPLTKDNLLLRDCVVKNTDFVEGIVVYAGRETKSLLNNGGTRYKRSKLERQMNREVIWCILILALMALFSATGSALWQVSFQENFYVWLNPAALVSDVIPASGPVMIAFTTFWTFIIIYQVLIPISLYVTIEIIKVMQVYHIHHDPHFTDEKNGTNINCRALNITEELGQVEYVFTDKTGTLTENEMVFQRCSINGVDYEHQPLVVNNSQGEAIDSFSLNQHLQEELSSLELQYIYAQPGSRMAPSKNSSVSQRKNSQRVLDFFFTLAACNTVIVARRPRKDQMNASGMIIESVSEEKGSPRQPNQSSKNHLFRSLFPSPRSLSPITSSPCSSPPSTPDGSPKHNPPLFPLSKFTPNFGLRAARKPEKMVNTFECVPEHEITTENANKQRPTVLVLEENYNSLHPPRTPSPGAPLDTLQPIYEAESPDELALVDAAYKYGCKLLRRNLHSALLSLPGVGVVEYEILNVLPFDSIRKRMSIIVKDPETGEKILYCKGADSAVLENLARRPDEATQLRIMQTQQHLNQYSKKGLRVLCMAKRSISDTEYEEWSLDHKHAENSLANRELKLLESYKKIETNMHLTGATGIEDRLQDGVPETIKALRKAGLRVWVLTGDKQETAINIAYSCALFTSNMEILKLNARTKEQTDRTISVFLTQIEEQEAAVRRAERVVEFNQMSRGSTTHLNGTRSTLERLKRRQRGLVIDGRTLVYILDRRANLRSVFLRLASYCEAVMCCRATPLQKALIVRLAKENLKVLTLAIGDGANDVSMIQTADVGVGISGVEGRQAVLSSDFAITRFRHLEKLLLVHGHWCYDRLARIILYFFYKNAFFVFLLMWYQLYCGYSTAVMIDDLYLVMFNLMFTSLPPMCVGIYDKDAPEDVLSSNPQLYAKTRLGTVYTGRSFCINIFDALYQSVIVFFFTVAVYSGSDTGVYEFGMTILHACLVTQLLHIGIETKSWTIIQVTGIAISYLVFFVFSFFYTVLFSGAMGLPSMYGELVNMVETPKHWFCVVLSSLVAVLPRFVARSFLATLWPDDVTQALRERHAINEGQFVEKMSRSSSVSSVFRPKFESTCTPVVDEEASDTMSSLVTMTTFISTTEETDA